MLTADLVLPLVALTGLWSNNANKSLIIGCGHTAATHATSRPLLPLLLLLLLLLLAAAAACCCCCWLLLLQLLLLLLLKTKTKTHFLCTDES